MSDLVLGRKATEEEQKVIDYCQKILAEVKLELIGTRPTDRKE